MGATRKHDADHRFYFDRLGDRFEAFMDDYDVERRLWLIFGRLLKHWSIDGRRILEVGCGTGRFSRRIADMGGRLLALDIGGSLVRRTAKANGCFGVVGDACKLPFAAGSFDVVVSSECIEHTPSPEKAIREMCRVCRPEGVVCLTTPNRLWYPVLAVAQALRLRKFAGVENWISPHRATRVMRSESMKDIALDGCHLWPFQARFLRPLLRFFDRYGHVLYPLMINFGIRCSKGSAKGASYESQSRCSMPQ